MINIYRRNFGRKIRHLRRDVFGYSIAHFAHLVDCDKDTIYEIEIGAIKCPEPQLILRIADVLDSFYMQFVRPKYEKIFLYNLCYKIFLLALHYNKVLNYLQFL